MWECGNIHKSWCLDLMSAVISLLIYTKTYLHFSVQEHVSLCRWIITQTCLDRAILGRAHISFVHQHTCLAHSFVHTAEQIRRHICGYSEAGVCTYMHAAPAWVDIVLGLRPTVCVT